MIIDAAIAADEPRPGMPLALALATGDALVRRALLLMQQSIAAPLPVARLATRIAADTDFCDLPHLIRAFRAAECVTSDAYRRAAPQP